MSIHTGSDFKLEVPDESGKFVPVDLPHSSLFGENPSAYKAAVEDQSYSVAGFWTDDDVNLLRVMPSSSVERIFLRVLAESDMWRPVSFRRRRLCDRDGHPVSRRAPQYSAIPSLPRFTGDHVSYDLNDVQPVQGTYFCYRCGRTVVPFPEVSHADS